MPLRWWRGMTSAAGTLTIPFGRCCCGGIDRLYTRQRLERGLVILLPGIQGKSNIESSVARGLDDAGIEIAIEIYDWTTGCWLLFPYHLRALSRTRREAANLADRVREYRMVVLGPTQTKPELLGVVWEGAHDADCLSRAATGIAFGTSHFQNSFKNPSNSRFSRRCESHPVRPSLGTKPAVPPRFAETCRQLVRFLGIPNNHRD